MGNKLRLTVQLLFTIVTNGYLYGFLHGKIYRGSLKYACVPGLNCYSCPGAMASCPIGALQALLNQRGFQVPFAALGVFFVFGSVLGRFVCGWLCPFGLVQDLLHKIPLPKWKLPEKPDRAARYLKYAVLLLLVLLLPALSAGENGVPVPWFCKYLCPAGTLEGGLPLLLTNPFLRQAVGLLFSWKALVLAAILAASMVIHRPFCKYLCPLGAFYALFNRFSFYQMHLDKSKCVGCGKCERSCPMDVEVTKNISSPECIRCGKCRSVCPTGAVSSGFACGAGSAAERGHQNKTEDSP